MSNKKYFIIYTLPRSGSAWVANFLTIPGYSICLHDPLCEHKSVRDLKARLDSYSEKYVGIVDTLAYRVFANLRTVFPTAKTVALVRPEKDINASLKKLGANAMLDTETFPFRLVAKHCDKMISYEGLFNERVEGYTAELLFRSTVGQYSTVPYNPERTKQLLSLNVQRKQDSYRERGWRNVASLFSEKIDESPSERGSQSSFKGLG